MSSLKKEDRTGQDRTGIVIGEVFAILYGI